MNIAIIPARKNSKRLSKRNKKSKTRSNIRRNKKFDTTFPKLAEWYNSI